MTSCKCGRFTPCGKEAMPGKTMCEYCFNGHSNDPYLPEELENRLEQVVMEYDEQQA